MAAKYRIILENKIIECGSFDEALRLGKSFADQDIWFEILKISDKVKEVITRPKESEPLNY